MAFSMGALIASFVLALWFFTFRDRGPNGR